MCVRGMLLTSNISACVHVLHVNTIMSGLPPSPMLTLKILKGQYFQKNSIMAGVIYRKLSGVRHYFAHCQGDWR